MARPIEEGASWFPHDFDMHLDRRVRALRAKHGLAGYAVYVMTLEVLTDSRHFEVQDTDEEVAMIAADFDVEPDTLNAILDTCSSLDLLQREDGYIRCRRLADRLEPIIERRNHDRERASARRVKQREDKGIVRRTSGGRTTDVPRTSGGRPALSGGRPGESRGEVLRPLPLLPPSSGDDGGSLTAAVSPTTEDVRKRIIEEAAENGNPFAAILVRNGKLKPAPETPPVRAAEDDETEGV